MTKAKKEDTSALYGSQSAFNLDDFKSAMEGGGVYRCASNDFWIDPFASMSNGVPMSFNAIDGVMKSSFMEPEDYVGSTVVMIDSPTFNPMEHKGALKRLSPDEIFFAKILAHRIGPQQQGAFSSNAGGTPQTLEARFPFFEYHLRIPRAWILQAIHFGIATPDFSQGASCG